MHYTTGVLYILVTFASLVSALVAPKASLHGTSACTQLVTALGAAKVQGPLSIPYHTSQEDYWNAKQSSYDPSCVVYPKSAQDVSTILKIIKTAGSRFAIKAAGHNPNTFFSSVDSGVLIDLNSMTQKSYDSSTTLGSYQPGGTFGDIYNYFHQYGRTVVGARLAGVGTGLALGGGLSYLSGQYGLACDSFRELEVVLPNGTIVTASPTENGDLFFADRGGGGNAYGVVTRYTVQTRPSGTFYAGNLIYLFKQTSHVLDAIHNFMKYNTDPKAAIIGTYEKLFTPAVGDLNLDEAVIMFLVYDGPDPGDAFVNFTALPHLLNTLGPKTYPEVVNMPIPMSTELSRGDNIFRVQVHRLDDDSYRAAFEAWEKWCAVNKGSYIISSLDFQPVPKSLTDASNSQNGGNAMQMPDGPWFWLNFLLSTPPGISKTAYDQIQKSFRDMVNSVPNAEGLPLFINDASYDQNPLQTFSTYSRLQDIKRKYDPDGFFESYTGGLAPTFVYMLLWNWNDLKAAWTWAHPRNLSKLLDPNTYVFWRNEESPEERMKRKIDDPTLDAHYKVMLLNRYREVPLWWWAAVMVISWVVGIICLYSIKSTLPGWGYLLALILTFVFTLFFGAQSGITGFGFNIQPICQMLAGYLFPGRPLANFYFTCFTYNTSSQATLLGKDLRLAQQNHISPRITFVLQITGCLVGGIFNWVMMDSIVKNQAPILQSIQGTNIWSGQNVQQFNTLAIAWSIASKMFSVGSRYEWVTLSYLIGFLVPIPTYIAYRYTKNPAWGYLNPSIILWYMGNLFVGINSSLTMFFVLAFISQFWIRKYHPQLFVKYNYLVSAAMDGGTQVMVFILTFAVAGGSGKAHPFPTWAGNPDLSIHNADYCMVNPANNG